MRSTILIAAVLALAACNKQAEKQTVDTRNVPDYAAEPQKGVDRSHKGQLAPDATFNGPDGKPTTLAAFKGSPVLVNLWATWCAPCVKELPTLDKSAEIADEVRVVAISQDQGPQASVDAFLKKLNIKHLPAYHDPKMALSGALGPDTVLPTTILYDADGKEVWRYVGDLDWTSPEAAKLGAELNASPTKG